MDERLDPDEYVDDPAVGFALGTTPDWDAPTCVWVPERLAERLRLLAMAYELHLLPHLDTLGRVAFNEQQSMRLRDELAFLRRTVDDGALRAVIDSIARLLDLASSTQQGVTFEGN